MLSAAVVQALLMHLSLWLPLSLVWVCGASLVVFRLVFDNIVNLSEKRRLKKVFGGYVSPSVLDGILKGSIDGSGQGKEVEVAILFQTFVDLLASEKNTQPSKWCSCSMIILDG